MGTAELHFINYDPELIWQQAMYSYIAEGGDILYPGSAKEMLLRSVQATIVRDLAIVDNALLMDSLQFATDAYLDLKGEKKYCYRIQAQAAKAGVTISFATSGIARTIPAGTALTPDGQTIYLTDTAIEQTGFIQTATVGITAEVPGTAGNSLTEGMQMQFCTPNKAVKSVVVSMSATGGRDRESDEHYRERIAEYGLMSITTGPSQQYEAAARAVSAEILDARALCIGPYQVCVYLAVSKESDLNTLIAAVEEALSPSDTRPMTDHVTAQAATEIPYTLNVTCTLEGSITADTMETVKNEYLAWQDNDIGKPFNPEKLMSMLYQAGAIRVQWAEGSHFNEGAIEYTPININERCSGTITLNCIT